MFISFNVLFQSFKRDTLDLVFTDDKHTVTDVKQEPPLGNKVHVHIGISWKYEIKIERVGEHTISSYLVGLMKKRIEKFQKIMIGYQNLCKDIEEFQSISLSGMYLT